MKQGDIIIDLHGNQYMVKELDFFHKEYPVKEPGICSRDTISNNPMNIHKLDNSHIGVMYNQSVKMYITIFLQFMEYKQERDIRYGYQNTKNNGINPTKGGTRKSSKRSK